MRVCNIRVGASVRVKDPARFCDLDGMPLPTDTFRVERIVPRNGYKMPWILLEGGRYFRASDLQAAADPVIAAPARDA